MLTGRVAALLLAALLAGACGETPSGRSSPPPSKAPAPSNPAPLVEGASYRPQVDPADFVPVVDNRYLPLRPGTTLIYEGTSDGEREVTKVTTTDRTREVMGVTTTVVRDRVFVDGELAEDTFDWFAQDRLGNVWYFGEETAEYEGGKVVTRKGSWEAGVDGAQPGIIMLGDLRVGTAYRQEFYEGEAEDVAKVIELHDSVEVPYGSFDDVLVTEDRNPLEPRLLEHKYYAPGVGVVLERLVEGGEEVLRLVDVRQAS
jgi:hypothetical protein